MANEDLSLERDRLASDCGAEAEETLMTEEPAEGGAVNMFHDNSGVEEDASTLLAEKEIEDQVFSPRRNSQERADGGKNLAAKTDIAMRHHRNQARFANRQELVEFDQITCGPYRARGSPITDCAADCSIFRFSMMGQQTNEPIGRNNTVMVGNGNERRVGTRDSDVTRDRLRGLSC